MDLQVILTSTVVAAVISTLTSVYNSRRTGNLKYITEERQKWREEIRKIAEDINDSSQEDIKKYLTKLKVRINAYGKMWEKSCYEDAHIWDIIEVLEQVDNNNQEFEKTKERLVYFLSLMLKYDWERQKREVAGSKISSNKLFLSAIITLIVLTSVRNIGSEQIVACAFIVAPNLSMFTYETILKLFTNKREETLVVEFLIASLIFIIIAVVGGLEIYSMMKEEKGITVISTIVLHILNIVLTGTDVMLYLREKGRYGGAIINFINQ